ncbi:LysR family transcriptional regulator [Natronospirillum operosum]|uniref:LysR family transcriptional regulator n=1 Tax=Natronospirillum operosum TaxID=2759953 RepID=A0A4Z0W436_9GAMM|nr:LysR family transcriptional regulator [Natronospirillum operosum]
MWSQGSPSKVHWDDFETVLAIAETGSLSGAARRLKVNHATVFRRLGDIEKRLGVILFDRSRRGYKPTQAGEEMADTAARIEEEVISAARRIAGRDLQPAGAVWITTTDSLLAGLLSPLLGQFRQQYPDITLDIAVSHQLFNLTKREADVAIRPTNNPPENLVGRRLLDVGMAIYGAAELINQHAELTEGQVPGLHDLPWVGPGAHLTDLPMYDWMIDQQLEDLCHYRVDSVSGMLAGTRAGIGVSALPCYLADQHADLIQLTDPIPELTVGLWFLMHPDLRDVARIRSLLDFTTDTVRLQSERLAGRPL